MLPAPAKLKLLAPFVKIENLVDEETGQEIMPVPQNLKDLVDAEVENHGVDESVGINNLLTKYGLKEDYSYEKNKKHRY